MPFIARWKGHIEPGTKSAELISQTDLMATFAGVTDVKMPDQAGEDSYNMLPALLGINRKPVREALVSQSGNGILALQQGEWKLVMSSGGGGSWTKPQGEMPVCDTKDGRCEWKNIQLYNLREDVAEEENLAEYHPDKVNEMIQLLAGYIRDGRSTPGIPHPIRDESLWKQVSWVQYIENQTSN
jgi:arylsulfatase A-like enzyme